MPNHMGTDAFFLKRGHLLTGPPRYPFDESVDAKAGDGSAANIEEHRSLGRSFETTTQQGAQGLGGVRPQRAQPDLASLTQNPNEG